MTPSNQDPNPLSASSTPDASGNGMTKQKIKEDARDAKREVTTKAREKAETGKQRLADEADSLSDAIDAAASNLDDHNREGLARYARKLSSNLANAAGHIEGRSVDELANDVKRLSRNNPALFMLGSIAVGFGMSRFFKASAERDRRDDENAYRPDVHRGNDIFQDDNVSARVPEQRREAGMMNSTPTDPRNGNGRGML